jgi:hypothetical protein
MSTNYAPSRRATTHAAHRPMEVDVAEARFTEAKAITDALVVRLSRERSELRGAAEGERVRVERRVQVTKLELVDARAYEERVFAVWEHERSLVAGRPVVGVRSDRSAPCGYSGVSGPAGASERHSAPPVGVNGVRAGRVS